MQSIFGTDGIRGIFNQEITYSLAYKVGYALGSTLKNNNPIPVFANKNTSNYLLNSFKYPTLSPVLIFTFLETTSEQFLVALGFISTV